MKTTLKSLSYRIAKIENSVLLTNNEAFRQLIHNIGPAMTPKEVLKYEAEMAKANVKELAKKAKTLNKKLKATHKKAKATQKKAIKKATKTFIQTHQKELI